MTCGWVAEYLGTVGGENTDNTWDLTLANAVVAGVELDSVAGLINRNRFIVPSSYANALYYVVGACTGGVGTGCPATTGTPQKVTISGGDSVGVVAFHTAPSANLVYVASGVPASTVTVAPFGDDLSGVNLLQDASGLGAATLDLYPQSRAASYQNTPSDPAGIGTTVKMAGLAGSITPRTTGRVQITISGTIYNSAVGDGVQIQIRYGTGTAPLNGAAVTGTAVGATVSYVAATAAQKSPVSAQAIVSGLTPGTTYWIDLSLVATVGGTANLTGLSISAQEQ